MIQIRKAGLEDVRMIKEIADLLYLNIPGFDWNKEGFIKGQIEKGEYYVAVSSEALAKEGRILGITSLRERNEMLYIETLAVAKDVQSKGVGSKLVDFARQFARENNFKILRTASFYEFDPRVKDFWIKQGFRLLDEPGEYGGYKFYRLEFKLND